MAGFAAAPDWPRHFRHFCFPRAPHFVFLTLSLPNSPISAFRFLNFCFSPESRRKQEGAFYTPAFIVEQSDAKFFCVEKRTMLWATHLSFL